MIAAALPVAVVIALTGCTGGGGDEGSTAPRSRSSQSPSGDVTSGPASVWEQTVEWERCTVTTGAQCATVLAPLDWADPEGETIELALARVEATDSDQRIGSLVINPGGPGGSGKSYLGSILPRIGAEVRERFDIVGFDPRGVGDSSAVTCYKTTAERDAYYAATWPKTVEGLAESVDVVKPFADACAANTGPLLGHVDTISSAKDMDLLRALLGDEKLNFLGFSYGTFLGATYAELFPQNVGRMVLDGALDPSVSADLHEVEQAAGFEAALDAYLDDCLAGSYCPFSGTKAEALEEIHEALKEIQAKPIAIPDGDGRDLTAPLAINGIVVTLYDDLTWSLLTTALFDLLDEGDGSYLLWLSDLYLERSLGQYSSNQMEAFIAINCLDARLSADPAAVEKHARDLAAASPTIGEFWSYSEMQCEVWPYPQVGEPHPVSAPGAEPIIVIGTTGDPATPYQGALALAEQLESSVLITFEGEGHTAYGRSNDCVEGAVDRYLVDGTPPTQDLTC
ncbi:MAG: alpha/beta hydrolase [Bifidobacteriaceae bacterium]|jgi:pimeloyl-ACP methyl ester carboxylesterase|nr:alpha/beta hydrolase [Bifidobacteriaceae bacterium]